MTLIFEAPPPLSLKFVPASNRYNPTHYTCKRKVLSVASNFDFNLVRESTLLYYSGVLKTTPSAFTEYTYLECAFVSVGEINKEKTCFTISRRRKERTTMPS